MPVNITTSLSRWELARIANPFARVCRVSFVLACSSCTSGVVLPGDVHGTDATTLHDVRDVGSPPVDSSLHDVTVVPDAGTDVPMAQPDNVPPPVDVIIPTDTVTMPDVLRDAGVTTLDLHDVTLFDNPADLANWAVTTTITRIAFQAGASGGLHVEFTLRDGPGSWPDITPPGWMGPLEYTVGFVENIGGHWYGSAAIQYWRGLDASGGNVAEDVGSMGQCATFGFASSCQVARNWYYDGRWGMLNGYQPATGEIIGVFVVAGNARGVPDGSQSPVHERSNVVLVPMPDFGGATYTF